MKFSLLEALLAILIMATVGLTLTSAIYSSQSSNKRIGRVVYAQTLASSIAQSVGRDSYISYPLASGVSGYPTTGAAMPNPRGYKVALSVQNYDSGASPNFSSSYADSGMQEVTISVTPTGMSPITEEVYKSNAH